MLAWNRGERKGIEPCEAGHVASEDKGSFFSVKNCVSVCLLLAKILTFVISRNRKD